mgnify:CR=1 FL=1
MPYLNQWMWSLPPEGCGFTGIAEPSDRANTYKVERGTKLAAEQAKLLWAKGAGAESCDLAVGGWGGSLSWLKRDGCAGDRAPGFSGQ